MRNLLGSLILLALTFQTGIHGQRGGTHAASPGTPAQLSLREGTHLEEAGDTARALEAYRRALREAVPNAREHADALLALASLETTLGKYPEGRRHAREAATVFDVLGDPRSRSMALNHAGLASLYEGNYRDAEQDFHSAIDLSRAQQDQEGLAEQVGNLANVQFFLGRYAEAARLYDDALAITSSSGSATWVPRRRRLLLANQASLYQRLGRDQQALALYHELGASSHELPPGEHAQLLANLGVLYRRLGDPIKALETYDAARALFARDRHVDGEIGVLNKRGIVLALDLGRLDEAERTFTEALEAAAGAGNRREALHAHLYRGETLLRARQTARARADYTAALELARELRTPEEEWKALYGIGRTSGAEGIDDLGRAVTTIESIRENIRVPSLRSDFLNDKREVYDALLASRLAANATPAEIFSLLERSHSRVWRERLGLSAHVDLAAVQHVLPEGVLILDYWNSGQGSAVVAVTRTRTMVARLNVDVARIGRLIDSLGAGNTTNWQAEAASLSQLLPLPEWFAAIEHVVIVPDGAFALVPFELLTIGDRFLIERVAVSYTPTAATFLRDSPRGSTVRAPWSLQLRAFGDPVFGSASLDDPANLRAALSATAEEVTDIASELAGREEIYLGEQDLKAQLFATRTRAPVLHIASHAMADANAMEQSRILFSSPGGRQSPADYLFLKEAYELPLEGVELAVLSACDTARGQLVRGEGVQSFSRAFLASGARSTVTTLWRVPDAPTREFMRIFYHYIQDRLPRDEALRRTKLRFRDSGSSLAHPHYWAAFVLTGDGVRPVPTALSWVEVLVPCALLVGAGVVLYRRSRRAR